VKRSSTSEQHVSKSPKSNELTTKWSDLPNMVDAIFDGDHDRPGWLHMFANANGRNQVDALFPQAHVEWHRLPFPGFPDDWRGMQLNLTECVRTMTTNLPLEVIPAGRTINSCTPDQLAMLLAFGVRRDGGRAAILRLNNGVVRVEIFKSRDN
jgi:hypothetical protein